MKISLLIQKLSKALEKYGDIDVTVSETLWMYNTVEGVKYIKHPYEDGSGPVIEIVDYVPGDDAEYYETV